VNLEREIIKCYHDPSKFSFRLISLNASLA